MNLEPGIHDGIPLTEYVRDNLRKKEITVSKGTLKTIYEQSPKHAHLHHPRLGGVESRDSSRADIGTIVHDISLGGDAVVHWVEAVYPDKHKLAGQAVADWRTNAAKEERDQARADGKIPLLKKQRQEINDMVDRVRAAMAGFGELNTEQTMLWIDPASGQWCRARPDAISPDFKRVVEVKTCENASPAAYSRTLWSMWYDVQMAHVAQGLDALKGEDPTREFFWLLVEINPPYATAILQLEGESMELAERRRALGLKRWAKCLSSNSWPGYQGIHYMEPPTYVAWGLETQEAVG